MLTGLNRGHPRLYLLNSDMTWVKESIARDPLLKQWNDEVEAQAEKMLQEPPVDYKLVRLRLLG